MAILESNVIINRIDDIPRTCNWSARDRGWDQVDTIVVHQTDTTCRNAEDQLISTANYHINHNNWCSIGYHIYIDQDGKIYQVNKLKDRGAHAGNANDYSIGIVMCGDWRLQSGVKNVDLAASKKQYKALVWTLAHIQNLYPQFKNIVSHQSVSPANRSDPNLHMDELVTDVKKKRLQKLIVKWAFVALLVGFIIALGKKVLYY